MDNFPVALVLAKNYSPASIFPRLSILSGQEAIRKLIDEKLTVLEYYDRPVLSRNEPIEYKGKILFWPSVVVDEKTKVRRAIRPSIEVLYLREKSKCFWCDSPISLHEATKDHVIPQSKGGDNSFENLVCSCHKCNTDKGDSMPKGKWDLKGRKLFKPSFEALAEEKFKTPTIIPSETWIPFLPRYFNYQVKT
jgi:5-methylcytosine-specific restriction endonuclease McrA